jgi:hypothetical protein
MTVLFGADTSTLPPGSRIEWIARNHHRQGGGD